MNCETLDGGLTLGCSNNISGIQQMWLTEKSNVTSTSLSSPGDEISTFTMAGSPVSVFYEYEFNQKTGSYTESDAHTEEAGRDLVDLNITLVLNRREKTKRDNLLLLRGKRLAVIILDYNDVYWYAPDVMMMTNVGGSGTLKSDPNQYVITLTSQAADPMNTATTAAVTAAIE